MSEIEISQIRQKILLKCNRYLEIFKEVTGFTEIKVRFQGEMGEDEKGMTRDLLSEFWKEFGERFGNEQLLFHSTAMKYLDDDEFVAIGKLFMFGFVFVGFLPFRMNK